MCALLAARSKGRLALLSVVPALLLMVPLTASASPSSQVLNLQVQGIIGNAGSAQYTIAGGSLVQGVAFSNVLSSGSVFIYSLRATVNGLQTTGQASLLLSSRTATGSILLTASVNIDGMVPAAVFPVTVSGTSVVNCDPSTQACNSEIPLLFTGTATYSLTELSNGRITTVGPATLPIAIESAYWNPFGGPILITSLDGPSPSISLAATYSVATISWSNVQVDGAFAGTVGQSQVSGAYASVSNSFENLVSGSEQDTGTITFADTQGPIPNSSGPFVGTTTIPLTGSFDCSALTGLPEGTCLATGATSSGSFVTFGAGGSSISGSYSTTWSVPSLTTSTAVTGHVSG